MTRSLRPTLAHAGLYLRTLRHLRAQQVFHRFYRHLPRRRSWPAVLPSLRALHHPWTPATRRPSAFRDARTVAFLNVAETLDRPDLWTDGSKPKLWLYQLHYFDDLVAEGADVRRGTHAALIERWIRENPPGCGIGWEPYPLSLRVCNWIKWILMGNRPPERMFASLVAQVRYLVPRLEYHLLGNHLLENFRALAMAGSFFEGSEAESWRRCGFQGLERETAEQVLSDGGHFELSPMYHGLVLEDLLDVLNVSRVCGQAVEPWLTNACARMATWACAMAQPDGEWCQFNDTALGYAARPADLLGYATRLGVSQLPAGQADALLLEASGFVRAHRGRIRLFADVGGLGPDYNPAHGHADTLSFELAIDGRRVLADTGVSTYEVGARRTLERSTAAHNTVEIDSRSSSEVWAAFRVGRRARVHDVAVHSDDTVTTIRAWHDGYRPLAGAPVHRREWRLTAEGLEIIDVVESSARHTLRFPLHLHPSLGVRQSATQVAIVDEAGNEMARILRGSWQSLDASEYLQASSFGVLQRGTRLVLTAAIAGSGTLTTSLRIA